MEKNGVTWYYYLAKNHAKKSLFDHEYIDTNTFVVRHEGKSNKFAAFPSPSHSQFAAYLMSYAPDALTAQLLEPSLKHADFCTNASDGPVRTWQSLST